jgi:hypothetical protein
VTCQSRLSYLCGLDASCDYLGLSVGLGRGVHVGGWSWKVVGGFVHVFGCSWEVVGGLVHVGGRSCEVAGGVIGVCA